MQTSKLGIRKGYHLSIEGIRRGYVYVENGIKKGKGLDLGTKLLLACVADGPRIV